MTTEALTTLANAKAWLNVTDGSSDAMLQRLITTCTQYILNYCSTRSFLYSQRLDSSNGEDTQAIMLQDFPVHSIVALSVDGRALTAAAQFGNAGYTLEPWDGFPPGNFQQLSLTGYGFTRGYNNVTCTYMAGYATLAEPMVASASAQAVAQTFGRFARDEGVKFAATGVALTKVASGPVAGQYVVDATGQYTFAAANAGTAMLVSYSWVPDALEQACLEWVGERFRYKSRIGERSRSLGGQESVSYSDSRMPSVVKELLLNFTKVMMP